MNNGATIDFSQAILTLALVVIAILIPFTIHVSAEPIPSSPMHVDNKQIEVVVSP
ncbi:hypothetical protein [Paenibacillus assamensis]|uniref:hypothetical protein n=1 Tax=Paenibacillus assamensis TaxID=311244 RepID=UPI0004267EE8|nr:hypothetical protein [Paenibacillus assamensis]